MDFTGFAAIEVSRSRQAERDHALRETKWLRELEALRRIDHVRAEEPAMRPPSGPTKLTGAYSPWI